MFKFRRKRKGNTIVEVIAATAILLIGMSGVSMAYSASSKMWQNENKRLDTSTFNKAICEGVRNKEKMGIKNLYEDFIKTNGGATAATMYIYFDNNLELSGDNINADEALKVGAVDYEDGFVETTSPSYSDCKANSGGKSYGALITITDAKAAGNICSLYKVKIDVWNLKDPGNFEASNSIYIGG